MGREKASAEVRPDTGLVVGLGKNSAWRRSAEGRPRDRSVGPALATEWSSLRPGSHSHWDLPAHRDRSEGGFLAQGLDLRPKTVGPGAFGRELSEVLCDTRTVRAGSRGTLALQWVGRGAALAHQAAA